MMIRPSILAALVAAWLAAPGPSEAQDEPLYRDPSPSEGPRPSAPVLSARSPAQGTPPAPPASVLGPFRPSGGEASAAVVTVPDPAAPVGLEAIREPLLGVPPGLPPLPAMLMPPTMPGDVVEFKRTTTIRGPNGIIGRFHDWCHDSLFGPPRPPGPASAPRHGIFGICRPATPAAEASPKFFSWPAWPSWPRPQAGA